MKISGCLGLGRMGRMTGNSEGVDGIGHDKKVLKLTVVMIAKLCERTRNL